MMERPILWKQFTWVIGSLITGMVLTVSVGAAQLDHATDLFIERMDRIECQMIEMNNTITSLSVGMKERRLYVNREFSRVEERIREVHKRIDKVEDKYNAPG